MRVYSLIVMGLSIFTTFICLIVLLYSVKHYNYPIGNLKGNAYKEHVNFDHFKKRELERSKEKGAQEVTPITFSESEWNDKWESSKKLSIEQIEFENFNTIIETLIWIGAMLLFFGLHLYLFRKARPVTITI